ncbi:hypothetical protein QTP88_017158 [Uroleucon formosanum]
MTKLAVLSTIARIFYPIGLIAPVIFYAKHILQKIWKAGLAWDAPLSSDLAGDWKTLVQDFHTLTKVKIPRFLDTNTGFHVQLCGFCDTSEQGYAAIVYLRLIQPNSFISISLLGSKTNMAPMKKITVTRLELCAFVLLARWMARIKATLVHQLVITDVFAWSDSQKVLSWLINPHSLFKIFVSNQVHQVHQLLPSCKWDMCELMITRQIVRRWECSPQPIFSSLCIGMGLNFYFILKQNIRAMSRENEIQSRTATINPTAVKSKILTKGTLPVVCPNLQNTDIATKDPEVSVKTVKPRRLSCTMGSSASLNEMDLVEAKIRMSNNTEGRLITRFFSMPDIDVITPTMEIQVPPTTVVKTDSKIHIESNVAEPPVTCVVLQDAEMADSVMAVKKVKPRRPSRSMGSSASLNEMDLVEAKIRVRSYAVGRQPKSFISTPNIEARTPTMEIRVPHDTTELKTLTGPTVTVVHAGQPDENTVKPKHRSLWSHIKKKIRCVLCCGCA